MSVCLDLSFWYGNGPGNPTTAAVGIGWVAELVSRLTQTPIPVHNSSTNGTLDDDPITFPLDQSIYVDATHDTQISSSESLPTSFLSVHLLSDGIGLDWIGLTTNTQSSSP